MKKAGIIGCGAIAQVHGWVLHGMEDVELTAVCDVDEEKAKVLSEQYADGRAEIYSDWRALCAAKLDVLHICTPHFLHVPMAVEALRCGKAVFMEKPCAISKEQFAELVCADAQYPGRLGFCFQNRYNETTKEMDRMISSGKIGLLTGGRAFVTWRRDEAYYQGSPWKGKWETEGGGVLINQSIHTLDLLLRYLGRPKKVAATITNHHLSDFIEVEDTAEAWLSFANGKRACFFASNGYVTDAPVLLELQGEKGSILLNGSEVTVRSEENGIEHFCCEQGNGIGKGYWGSGHRDCISDFYRCLCDGSRFPVGMEEVKATMQTLFRIYDAGRK